MQTAAFVMDLFAALPNPGQGQKPPGGEDIEKIIGWAAWISFSICIVGVFAAGGAMAFAQSGRGGGGEHAARLGWVLAGCVVIGSASGIVGALA